MIIPRLKKVLTGKTKDDFHLRVCHFFECDKNQLICPECPFLSVENYKILMSEFHEIIPEK